MDSVLLPGNTHDLRLPAWGPYSKMYMGVSHIPDPGLGLRFDLSVWPGFYRGGLQIPNVKWESGYHPWEAAPDLRYFCHRHELLWQDQVFVDISFSQVDNGARLVRCACVNNTDLPQGLVLHYMAAVFFPPLRTNDDQPLCPTRVSLPPEAVWIDALDYEGLAYATPRPTDNLMPDGLRRGEVRDHGFVDGTGLGRGFGGEAGDRVWYRVALPRGLVDGMLLVRCRAHHGTSLELAGLAGPLGTQERARIDLPAGEGFHLVAVPVGALSAGDHTFGIVSRGSGLVELDGLVFCEAADRDAVAFEPLRWNAVPERHPGPVAASLRLCYQDFPVEYGLAWDAGVLSQVREIHGDDLDCLMRRTVHNHTATAIYDRWAATPQRHLTDVFLRPITVAPHSERVLYAMVCRGDAQEVEERLWAVDLDRGLCDALYEQARARVVDLGRSPEGSAYRFSQERMAATTLTNVVYPVCIKGTYIRHNTPGRWWDSLYTWDSGFIGLGLLEMDAQRAVDCLNAYLTEPGDPHAAFVHHGSPVPVQFYLFLELWNRHPERALLAHFYPRLRQYYAFLSGQQGRSGAFVRGSSTTRALQSNLLKTWDYFYNSGGWDDYPAQVHVHQNGLTGSVAPAITTAQCIRVAKILHMIATALSETEDVAQYERDVDLFSTALQTHAWDPESGYFGYVMHDEQGRPHGILRHESGTNLNRGMDGMYPLVAGICTPDQEARILAALQDPQRHWTPIGLSTVDRSSPYFREDGYWNGAVWMPHQWFFWKTCLDLGEDALAWRIARTGLETWRQEVDASYQCYEHFIVATGRGAGWHHFGGLSTPVLSWYGAYYRPPRLTSGFDVWVQEIEAGQDGRWLEARLRTYGNRERERGLSVLLCLAPEAEYVVTWNGEVFPTVQVGGGSAAAPTGSLYVHLPCMAQGVLRAVAR